MLTVGLGGVSRNGCVAICDEATVVGVCEQERVTRVRSAGFNSSGLPDEALDTLLERTGHRRSDIGRYIAAEAGVRLGSHRLEHLDHHLAHAATAYLTSPFSSAVIVVCDHDAPKVSVWEGRGADIARVDWTWNGPGFSDIYSACTQLIGFSSNGGDQRLEALARLNPDARDQRVDRLLSCDGTALVAEPDWKRAVEILRDGRTGLAGPADAPLAAALQARISELVVSLLQVVRTRFESPRLCLGGSFFYHSSMNTAVKTAGLFTDVFVPVDPGNSGLAVGAALHATHNPPSPVSPFLGPSYSSDEIKEVLDNCKLQYEWRSEAGVIAAVIDALRRGLLVGWFDTRMEWGPRALGARCIIANPFSPYVLENLNRFLKHREPWRGYAISGLEHAVGEHLDGPTSAPFMECDYRPRDRSRFAHMLPSSSAAIRVQTVGAAGTARFRLLLEAFGRAVGLPFILNTSFNGFHEPIVCNPRDAVRVFYGTGIDLLVLDQFLVRK